MYLYGFNALGHGGDGVLWTHIGTPSRHFSARLRAERIEGKISERRSLALCIYRDRAG
jgi:hypothetical protein